MRIPYGFVLISGGTLRVNEHEANIVSMIFEFYMAGASLGKVVDMLYSKQISSPTGKTKWTRAAVDHLLSNGKYVAIVGLEKFLDVQFEKAARCNIDYDKEGSPRKDKFSFSLRAIALSLLNVRSSTFHCVSTAKNLVDLLGNFSTPSFLSTNRACIDNTSCRRCCAPSHRLHCCPP